MRKKTKLLLGVAASFLVSALVLGGALFILGDMQSELARSRVYDEALIKASALNVLVVELKENSDPSDFPQIMNVHASIGDLLEQMSSGDDPEASRIRQIRANHTKLGHFLAKLHVSETGPRKAFEKERRAILFSQLWMNIRQISDEIGRLRHVNQANVVSVHDKAEKSVYISMAIFVLSVTLIFVLSDRQISQSEEALRRSEARYRYLFEAANVGKSVTLPSGEINVNKAFCTLLGYRLEELENKSWQELTPPEEVGPINDLLAPLIRGEKDATRFEKRYVHKNGSLIWGDVSVAIQRDDAGQPLHFLTTVVDITERKHAAETLTESEEKFKNFFEFSPLGKIILGADGSLQANRAFCDLLGYTLAELRTKKWQSLVHPDDIPASEAAIEALRNGQAPLAHFEARYLHKGGKHILAEVTTVLQRDKEQRPHFFMTTLRDITRRRQVEEELRTAHRETKRLLKEAQEARQALLDVVKEQHTSEAEIRRLNVELEQRVADRTRELKESQLALLNVVDDLNRDSAKLDAAYTAMRAANQELEAFSYSVSHDLRAPLRAIHGYVKILVEDYGSSLDAEGRRVCGVISQSARSMGRLIDDLLAFSRVGRAEINSLNLDMAAAANSSYYALTTPESRARIEFHVSGLPRANGDSNLLRHVWMNLIGNAIKFSAKKERPVITVNAEQKGDEVVYSVRDNGDGFDMRYAPKLFGVFQRLHSTKEFDGTGVGLAIVERIILRHNGRVWAEGEKGQGATFYFSLKKGA